MADLNVERKGPSIWPWVIGLLALVLVIWAAAEFLEGGDENVIVEETTLLSGHIPSPRTFSVLRG